MVGNSTNMQSKEETERDESQNDTPITGIEVSAVVKQLHSEGINEAQSRAAAPLHWEEQVQMV